MTITTSNLTEVPLFLRRFRELGFDRVNFGFVKETVPLFLESHPDFAARLIADTSLAMEEVGGPDVDAFRLAFLGLWRPTMVTDRREASTGARMSRLVPMITVGGAPGLSTSETAEPLMIGDHVLRVLRTLGHEERAVAFIRHSEREKRVSPAELDLDHVPLTVKGHELARRFGRMLPRFAHAAVSHTSIIRSIQTAAEIDEGYREVAPETPSVLRGKDSAFSVIYRGTLDKKTRNEFRASLRGQAFAQMWLDGRIPLTIMRPALPTLDGFLRELRAKLLRAPPSTLHIHVGHDREIELVRTAVLGGRLSDFPMMDFLDGLVFRYREGSPIRAQWRNRAGDLATSPPFGTGDSRATEASAFTT